MTDEKTKQLENRIDKLESTIEKMMPSRRDALKMGGAALVGGAAMSGAASAQPGDQDGEAGVIGTDNDPVDIEASDIEVDDLVVNGTATGPFGGAPVLEAGDSLTVATIDFGLVDEAFDVLYNGSAKDMLGGIINGRNQNDFKYTFSDNSTITQNGSGVYLETNRNVGTDSAGDEVEIEFLPPARDVIKIEVGCDLQGGAFGAQALLRD